MGGDERGRGRKREEERERERGREREREREKESERDSLLHAFGERLRVIKMETVGHSERGRRADRGAAREPGPKEVQGVRPHRRHRPRRPACHARTRVRAGRLTAAGRRREVRARAR